MAFVIPKIQTNTSIPNNLSMQNFISKMDTLGAPAKGCRFAVQIFPRNYNRLTDCSDLFYLCDAAQLPGRGFGVTEVRYYGPSLVLPNNSEYQAATFSFICNQKSAERYFFDEWMDIINPTSSFNFEFAENYYCDIKIYQLAEFNSKDPALREEGRPYGEHIGAKPGGAPDVIYGWTLRRAWPVLLAPTEVSWQDQDIVRLQVTFSYRFWDRKDFMEAK